MTFSPLDSIPVTSEDDRVARHWFKSSDPSVGVGAKHHTVPAFYLRRFADATSGSWFGTARPGACFPRVPCRGLR
jgi:hypothetical protein